MIERVELKWNSDIPVYLDTHMEKNQVLVGRGPNNKFVVVGTDVYETLKWNEFDINEERFRKLKELLYG